ncbi:hypothetical protein fsci_15600 [Francisella sciaenopsi]|uniref:Uncharacterized protein n=1 Tax=Francisella sciaenopsi TaxID=3055034 RepID=A0ABQ6PHD4_9GAMM
MTRTNSIMPVGMYSSFSLCQLLVISIHTKIAIHGKTIAISPLVRKAKADTKYATYISILLLFVLDCFKLTKHRKKAIHRRLATIRSIFA